MTIVHEVESGKHGMPSEVWVRKGYPPMKSNGFEGKAVPMNMCEEGNGSVVRSIGCRDCRLGKRGKGGEEVRMIRHVGIEMGVSASRWT